MTLPAENYFTDPRRTNGEAKQAQDDILETVRTLEESAAGALTADDIGSTVQGYDADTAKTDVVQSYTRQHYAAPVAVTSSSGALALNCDLHAEATITLSENTTVSAPSNRAAGKYIVLHITGASTYTLSWNAAFLRNSDRALPSAPAAGKTISVCIRCMGTTNLRLVGVMGES